MPSANITALTNYGGAQVPADLMYIGKSPFGATDDRKSTLNDLFAEITKNITDLTVQFGDGAAGTVSAAGKGKLRYNNTAGSFQVSENGAAYQNLLKGNGTATRVAFWSAADELDDDANFYWDDANKRLGVGVGSTPGAPIDVLAEGVSAIAQQWRPNSGSMRAAIKLDGGPETFFGTTTAHNLHLITSDVQRLSIEATSGNVGINKATAIAAQLQIVANAATTKGLIVNSAPSTSVNLVEFYNDNALRFVFGNGGNLTLGLAGASGATGSLTFSVNGQANTTTLRAGGTPASTVEYRWPSDDPAATEVLTVTSFAAGVATLEWAAAGSLSGSGVATRVAFWTGATSLGSDAAYYWDNTNKRLSVGVGTSPGAPIDVLAEGVSSIAQQWRPNSGTMRAAIKLDGGPETFFGTTTAHNLHLITSDVQRLSIEATSGNVGINKATAIAAQLQIVANAATTKGLIVNSAPSTSVNLVEFYNDNALRFVFGNSGNLTLGLAGASGATGSLTFSVNGQANTQTLSAGDTPAATNIFKWPSADPTAGQALTASAPSGGVVTLSWTTVGGATINPTDNVMPYRQNSTTFGDSSLTITTTTLALSQATVARTSGAPTFYNRIVTPADTGLTASTESVGFQVGGSTSAATVSRQFATGALTTQREYLFVNPTYTFVGASTLTTAATVAIAGSPVAGANATITNPYALWVQAGITKLEGILKFENQSGGAGQTVISVAFNTLRIRNAADSGAADFSCGRGEFFVTGSSTSVCRINTDIDGINLGSARGYGIASTTSADGSTPDIKLIRATASVFRISNGSTGIGSLLVAPSTASVTGNFTVLPDNAATNTVVTVARLGVNSTGTAADGFGAALSWSAETSTTNDTETGRINVFWSTATHASRTSAISWTLSNNASLAEVMRLTTPSATVGSPFVLNIHDGTNPNVWTNGSFAAKIYLISPTLPAVGVAAHFSATALDAPQWQMLRGRGTNASPTAIQANDSLGNIEWWGQTSTSTNNVVAGARIRVSATENWSAGNNGCQMIFFVSNNAGTITARMSLVQTGTLRVGATSGTTSTDNKLQVGNYASWNNDAVAAIYTEADDNKGLEIIGTAAQTADLFRCFLDTVTPDKLTLSAAGKLTTHWLNWNGEARVSTQFDKTSDTTLANVTGLSINVVAGRTYSFKAVLYTTSNVAGGVKAAIGGTATATAIRYEAVVFDNSTIAAQTRATALGSTVGAITAVTAAMVIITGTITVNAAGTLTVQFAQNASNATASSVLTGSVFIADDVP